MGLTKRLTQLAQLGDAQLAFPHTVVQASSPLGDAVELGQQLDRRWQRRRLEALLASLQVQPRILLQALANLRRAAQPGVAQLGHFAAGQLGGGNRRSQPSTILTALARDRHQVAHRRMGRDLPLAHLLLDRRGELTHQSQMPRHPAQALVEASRKLLLAHPLLVQGRKQPALLELREGFGVALTAVQEQRLMLGKIPRRRRHRIGAQPLQTAQTLESVDDQVTLGLAQRDDDNRHLLAMLGQRRQQAALTLRTLAA